MPNAQCPMPNAQCRIGGCAALTSISAEAFVIDERQPAGIDLLQRQFLADTLVAGSFEDEVRGRDVFYRKAQ